MSRVDESLSDAASADDAEEVKLHVEMPDVVRRERRLVAVRDDSAGCIRARATIGADDEEEHADALRLRASWSLPPSGTLPMGWAH